MPHWIRNIRNSFDFFVRSRLRMGRRLRNYCVPENERRLQSEFAEFMGLFDWRPVQEHFSQVVVADIGARNFSFGPVIESHLNRLGMESQIHGIEVDAHRLLAGFYSRASYGHFFASSMNGGNFHAMDFLEFKKELNLAFLLNPFVTSYPLVRWGLPISMFKPERIYSHVHHLLRRSKGFLLASHPHVEEYNRSLRLAEKAGFRLLQEVNWKPQKHSAHSKPRLGSLFQTGRVS